MFKITKEHIFSILFLVGLLALGGVIEWGENAKINEDVFGLFIALCLGILGIFKYRQLTLFLLGHTKGLKSTWSRKWEPLFTNIFILVISILFIVFSLSELLPLVLQ